MKNKPFVQGLFLCFPLYLNYRLYYVNIIFDVVLLKFSILYLYIMNDMLGQSPAGGLCGPDVVARPLVICTHLKLTGKV